MTEIVEEVGENEYEIVVTELTSHVLSFIVYDVLGKQADGTQTYNRKGYKSSPDPVNHRSLAQEFMSGSIKWDGCLDFSLEDEPVHFCSRSDVEEFNKLLPAIYDLAAKYVSSYEGD